MSYHVWPSRGPRSYPIIYPTDPAYSGPGTWRIIHVGAKIAEKVAWFQDLILMIIITFACDVCRKHASEYIDEYPIPKEPGHLFEWTVIFHNTVNTRLGKPRLTIGQARRLYETLEPRGSYGIKINYNMWPSKGPRSYPILYPTDPSYSGPGTWRIIHVGGKRADEEGKVAWYHDLVLMIINSLVSETLVEYSLEYIDEYPIPERPGHCFEWSVMFHNTVNIRLRKPLLKTEQARRLYETSEPKESCGIGCESAQ